MCVTADGALAVSLLSNLYFLPMYTLWQCRCKL